MSDYGHEQTDKELKRIENLISKEYSQAAKELEDKMLKQFESFNARDVKMRAKLKAGEITQTEYNNWLYNQVATGDRWRSLRDSMVNTLVDTDKAATTIIQGNSIKAYADNMNYSTYKIEHDSKINTGFTLYDENTVKNLLKEDPKIIPLPKVDIPKDELWNRQHLTSAVTQGILQGESIPQIADRLQNVAFMGRNSAIRNARTYTTAAENKGRIDSYERAEKLGIQTNKKWIATLDEKTRAEHRHLDGMSVPYKEDFKVDGYTISFPGDPSAEPEMFYNCRCTLVDDIVGYPYNDERKDDKLGDMTYEEWKHAKDKEPKSETKKEIKFVEVHNKQEAKAELEKIFGSVESNFMKNDERLIVENTNQLLKLNARFNAITENNTGYLTASPSGRAMGYTSSRFIPDPSGKLDERTNLGLVGKYYKNYDTVIKTEEMGIEKFWSMPTSKENLSVYTVTHEYGHILENLILVKRTDYDDLQNKIDNMIKPSAQQSRGVYQKAEKSGAKNIFNEIVAIAKDKNPEFNMKDNLSVYGHTNHFEAFAEIFANSQCGEPNELGLAMQEWLEKEGF